MTEFQRHSSGALITNGRQWLFMLRDNNPNIPNPNLWGIIGGKGEPGENPCETLAREVKEEIGIELLESQFRFLEIIDGQKDSYTKNLYLVRLNKLQLVNVKKGVEGQVLGWFSKRTVATMLSQGDFVPDLPRVIHTYVLRSRG